MRRDLYRLLAPVSGDITARGLCGEDVRRGGDAGTVVLDGLASLLILERHSELARHVKLRGTV